MNETVHEWVHMLLRWAHVIAAIAWIGHAFLFNELEREMTPPEEGSDDRLRGLAGDVWMVHGGGFFHLEKTTVLPERRRGSLVWFKWEAALTWITGFALLWVVYYLGGGAYLVNRETGVGAGAATAIGLASLVAGFLVYTALCYSPLARPGRGPALAVVGLALIGGLAFALTKTMSGRAAYLHVGAAIGTIMVANVWMVIIPAMKRMVATAGSGAALDPVLGARARQRSLHNNYLVYPVILVMIGNHYPLAYGHPEAWLILVGLVGIGVAVKHVMNVKGQAAGVWLSGAVLVAGALVLGLATGIPSDDRLDGPGPDAPRRAGLQSIDPATTGIVRGVVRLRGAPPAPEEFAPTGGCRGHGGKIVEERVAVSGGMLADVFVRIVKGHERWRVAPAPPLAVEIDQKGCVYRPRLVGLRCGQSVVFVNSDAVQHNVRLEGRWGRFNKNMAEGEKLTKRFRIPESMAVARCDLHPWMGAFIGVCDHPWFAVSSHKGTFRLENVPPGEYVLEAWHEVFGRLERKVKLGPRGDARVEFVFETVKES